MSGERPKLSSADSDLAVGLTSISIEQHAVADRVAEAATIFDGLEGPMRRGLAVGIAEQCRELGDAYHYQARLFEAVARESGPEAPTRRDVAVRKRDIVTTLRIVCLSLAGGLGAAAGAVGLATAWPKLALVLGGLGAFFGGCAITLPLPKP